VAGGDARPVDEVTVRARAQALCDGLVAGDVDAAIADFSPELRRNLGEIVALFPLPATEAAVESVERGGSGFVVVVRLVGETEETRIQTRWKARDDRPTVVEASHLSATAVAARETESEGAGGET
jgi:hypothetical protein